MKPKGFSLIEAAIVLGIVGLVIGGIWVAAAAVAQNNRVSEMAKDVLSICARAKEVFPYRSAADTGNPANRININVTAYRAGLVPKGWKLATSSSYVNGCCGITQSLYTPLGEGGLTQFDKDYPGSGGNVSVSVRGVPQSEAIKLVRGILGPISSMGTGGNSPISRVAINACAGWSTTTGPTAPCTLTPNIMGQSLDSVVFSTATDFEIFCRTN